METGGTDSKEKILHDTYAKQINVLKSLSYDGVHEPREFHLSEIAEASGLQDEGEVQRCLFILEGQKLVAPCPPGDFTSKTWHITRDGLKTIKHIRNSLVQ